MEYQIPITLKSQNVCQSCRIGKQRCDKSLPSCSRCVSRHFSCTYAATNAEIPVKCFSHAVDSNPATTAIAPPLLLRRACCLDLSNYGARELFGLFEVVRIDKWAESSHWINNILKAAQIIAESLVDEYFATIHTWLPIINENRFRSRGSSTPENEDAGLAILIWSFFLVTQRPCKDNNHDHSMNNLLYQTTKQIFMLQVSKDGNLELLQAGLIITYYACGHGLLRDAHLILTICLAIAQQIGVDFETMSLSECACELEDERSACRGAIILLDRTIALATLTNPLPSIIPTRHSFDPESPTLCIPSNKPKQSLEISSRVASFIGTAVAYSNDPRSILLAGSSYQETCHKIENLAYELICMSKTGKESYLYCESTSLAFCTLLNLQTSHHKPSPSSPALNSNSNSKPSLLLHFTLRMIRQNLHMATILLQEERAKGLPVVAICTLSRTAAILVRFYKDELSEEDLEMVRGNLERFKGRWGVCALFLRHIDGILGEG